MTSKSWAHSNQPLPAVSIVVPCYNEQEVLPETARRLAKAMNDLTGEGLIANWSVVFVDDGSDDDTWAIITDLAQISRQFAGIKLTRNVGHQNALLSGLLNTPGDVIISIDADLQDDPAAIREMLVAHRRGADIVYGVRKNRQSDTAFKSLTAKGYYRLLQSMGVNIVFNHADYRLMSRRSIEALREFGEVNLFLRGIIPQLGFNSKVVTYDRHSRLAGKSKYPPHKMLALGLEGITSFSVKPLRLITIMGALLFVFSFLIGSWAIAVRLVGHTYVPGWTSILVATTFIGGMQLLSLGILGEYLGKIYLETKRRPRFIVDKFVGPVRTSGAVTTGEDDLAPTAIRSSKKATALAVSAAE
jgi:glycosyltransferase involved in cell wall biosynthesis